MIDWCVVFPNRSGYEQAAKHFVAKELDVAVVGRSFIITGANSGIGKATATAIAKKGTKPEIGQEGNSTTLALCNAVIQKNHDSVLPTSPLWFARWYSPHVMQEQGES